MGSERFIRDSVYLSPAPMYHAAPLKWSIESLALGASVVLMERFEPEAVLDAIQTHRVTHAQFVPTMFVRMLKLPEEVRIGYDVSSLVGVIHAAAPCPPDVKRQMMDWMGPVSYTHLRAHETVLDLVCRLLLEDKNIPHIEHNNNNNTQH